MSLFSATYTEDPAVGQWGWPVSGGHCTRTGKSIGPIWEGPEEREPLCLCTEIEPSCRTVTPAGDALLGKRPRKRPLEDHRTAFHSGGKVSENLEMEDPNLVRAST